MLDFDSRDPTLSGFAADVRGEWWKKDSLKYISRKMNLKSKVLSFKMYKRGTMFCLGVVYQELLPPHLHAHPGPIFTVQSFNIRIEEPPKCASQILLCFLAAFLYPPR